MGCVVGEAGQSQPIGALADRGDGVNVAAEVQPGLAVARWFWFMAQPKASKPGRGLLDAFASWQAAVMIAAHQQNLGVQALVERLKIRPQAFGQAEGTMNQIAENDQLGGLPPGAERFKSLQGVSILVAW